MGLSCALPWELHVNPTHSSMRTGRHILVSMCLLCSISWEPHVNPICSTMRSRLHIHLYWNRVLHCDLAPLAILRLWGLFRLPFGFQKSCVELHVGVHVSLQVLPIYICSQVKETTLILQFKQVLFYLRHFFPPKLSPCKKC